MKIQTSEIIKRNKGDVNDLLLHLNNEIHLNSILAKGLNNGILKEISMEKALQLQLIKSEFQIGLVKYNKENNLNNDKL